MKSVCITDVKEMLIRQSVDVSVFFRYRIRHGLTFGNESARALPNHLPHRFVELSNKRLDSYYEPAYFSLTFLRELDR